MNTTANLGKAPVRTLVLQLAIPSMTAQFVNVLYSIIDRMYIGHISENGALALAGAGICVNNPVPVSLLSGDRKPQIRFLGNHHSGSGNLYHKSFRM